MRSENKNEIDKILNLLHNVRDYDFAGCSMPMLNRRIRKRIFSTKTENFNSYYKYLQNTPEEFDALINVLTINVSKFFRNPICFEYLSKGILPSIAARKSETKNSDLRIWSAGCSTGEEPYSVAINVNEYLEKAKIQLDVNIFATDIDKNAISTAREGKYRFDSIEEVKTGILKKYFTNINEDYFINSKMKKMVSFSSFDLLDKNKCTPPDSIFGGFDIVLCRNVLIYFNTDYHEIIFKKLYRSLNPGGYLVLGEAEIVSEKYKNKFKKTNSCCKIYIKT